MDVTGEGEKRGEGDANDIQCQKGGSKKGERVQ